MATTTIPEPNRPFARLTEGRTSNSWRAAIPIVVGIVAAIALLAYLASQLTSYSTRLAAAQRDSEASQQSAAAAQKRAAQLETESNLLKGAGRTTVLLESADKSADKAKPAKKGAPAVASAWGAATWGESDTGKTWLRLSAYGLQSAPEGKSYGLWFTPTTGQPVYAGKLDPATDGSAFAMAKELPGIDQGKSLSVSLDEESAKAPGAPLMVAQLPTLKPGIAAKPAAAPSDKAAAPPDSRADAKSDKPSGSTEPSKN